MTTDSERFVELGVVGRPHGVRGETRIFLHNPDSDLLLQLENVLLAPAKGGEPVIYDIESIRNASGAVLVVFGDVTDRNEAEKLKGFRVLVPRELLPDVADDEFYIHDLIGVAVFVGDQRIGEVSSSRPQGDIEMVTVSTESYTVEIPLVDQYVEELIMKERILRVVNIEDLPRQEKRTGSSGRVQL